MQATSPLRLLKILEIYDVESADWLPMLAGATSLITLGVCRSPCDMVDLGVLSAIDGLPALRQYFRPGDLDEESLLCLGQLEAKLRKRGAAVEFAALWERSLGSGCSSGVA